MTKNTWKTTLQKEEEQKGEMCVTYDASGASERRSQRPIKGCALNIHHVIDSAEIQRNVPIE